MIAQQHVVMTQYLTSRPPPPASKKEGSSPVPPIAARIPRRRPPKLMHILSKVSPSHHYCSNNDDNYILDLDEEEHTAVILTYSWIHSQYYESCFKHPSYTPILGKDGRTHDLAKEAREDYNMDLDVELEQVNTRILCTCELELQNNLHEV